MVIKTDKKGQEAIQQLCDIALKTGGLQNLKGITTILNSIELFSEGGDKEIKKPDHVKADKK
jgi:hypothetical protein